MTIPDALSKWGCKYWESVDYIGTCPDGQAIPLLLGFYPMRSKFVAVCQVEHYEDIVKKPPFLFNFLSMVNDCGGIGCVIAHWPDIDWHFNLERWKDTIRTSSVREKLIKLFLRKMAKIVGMTTFHFNADEPGIWWELVEFALAHKDYEIWNTFVSLRGNDFGLAAQYGQFLQFYRGILTNLFKNKFE